ncbi:metallophosphoesterase [Polyangium aurulentum]|uniref:metallophosphoesterase n=1 Tax=Polyangium aurulentum TaxID=2567896 RepID=UPI0010AEEA98|nr:metallophosphoesterase [Polyangium aurulentum]UQA61081.1 metallophosphoesterase [Polyangium aurulentum]
MSTRLLVLSDLHIAPPGDLAAFKSGPMLAAFLREQARADTTLVLAGDIFDLLHVRDHPGVLDMPGAPDLLRRTFQAIAEEPWGRDIFQSLAALLEAGGRCILLPGNHDPELFHPNARAILLDALGLANHSGLVFHTDDVPLRLQVGPHPVLIGHGHRVDAWNDIDPSAVRRAIAMGARDVALPPGSRLVHEVLRPFKLAKDAHTGRPRFPFVDLLKPELPAVPLLLLYLDPAMCGSLLDRAFGVVRARLTRRFARRLRLGPVLGSTAAIEPPENLDEVLADALAQEISERDRRAPEATMHRLEAWLDGTPPPREGTLVTHSLWRAPLRAALRLLSQDGSFFNEHVTSADDEALIAQHLTPEAAPCVGIFGHTHAARHIERDGWAYINTGTWMGLMKLPQLDDEEETRAWIDALEAGQVPREERLTYAEVTDRGAALVRL